VGAYQGCGKWLDPDFEGWYRGPGYIKLKKVGANSYRGYHYLYHNDQYDLLFADVFFMPKELYPGDYIFDGEWKVSVWNDYWNRYIPLGNWNYYIRYMIWRDFDITVVKK